MPQVRLGLLQSHSQSLDLLSRVLHIVFLWSSSVLSHSQYDLVWDFHSSSVFIVALVAYCIGAEMLGLFSPMRNLRFRAVLARVVWTVVIAIGLAAVFHLLLLKDEYHYPAVFWWSWLGWCLLVVVSVRSLIFGVLRYLRTRGCNMRRAVIVGSGSQLNALVERLDNNRWMGIQLLGVYTDDPTTVNVQRLGGKQEALEQIAQWQADYVYIALPMREADFIETLTDQLLDSTATVMLVPDIFGFQLFNSQQGSIDGLPIFSLVDRPYSLFGGALKRFFDIGFSFCALILLALPMLIIALLIKLDSRGPVIFKQRRYGIDGRAIDVWKFRSMRTLDNGVHVQQAVKDDPRITRIGRFLRCSSLDELPQFINVLQGSMSIVGPRPHAVAHNELYRTQIKGYMLRHKMKPGITGLAQISGCRGETDTLEKMQARVDYDLQYLKNWSLWLDIKIILKTLKVGFFSHQAY